MSVKTIQWSKNRLKIIDQTRLPAVYKSIYCGSVKSLWKAIKLLKVRGAPALGVAGAYGIVLGIKGFKAKSTNALIKKAESVGRYLGSSRPTAVNLFWAVERMKGLARKNTGLSVPELKKRLLREAKLIEKEDKDTCRSMGRFGASLIKSGDTLLTHCNAGALATADYGTALGVMYSAKKLGKKFKVYVDETRPLLQGARLTAWELKRQGVDTTLICDNMAASLMAQGKIDKIFVGADRIASNGDTANKIGTYGLAVLARHHKAPFYVAAPVSTIDFKIKSGKEIPIEERNPDEVRCFRGAQAAPKNIKVYNPAFDVTPNALITAIVTEKGICKPPFKKSLMSLRG